MKDRYLYLFGGNPSFVEGNEAFIARAGGKKARIALLITYTVGWEKYLPAYTNVWRNLGIKDYSIIIPNENGKVDYEDLKQKLSGASGIFIGGGDTYLYRQAYATSPIKELIKDYYEKGIPIAGCSAGALISLKKSFIIPGESRSNTIDYIEGIGLLSDLLIGVHHTEDQVEPHLIEAMNKLAISKGIGIDENACVIFKNEKHEENIGDFIHMVERH